MQPPKKLSFVGIAKSSQKNKKTERKVIDSKYGSA